MPTYKIGLARTYLITIKAENAEYAKMLSENFIVETDVSTSADQHEYRFAIDNIEILENDVFECEDAND